MTRFEYITNTTPERIAERLRAASSVLITSHEKPDGDAVGSCAAIARALSELGVNSEVWLLGAVATSLRSLVDDLPIRYCPAETPGPEHDLILVLDTGAWSQLQPIESYLRPRRESTISIDHHERGDDIASERIVEAGAASCTQVLIGLLDVLGVPLASGGDERGHFSIAEALLLGLATDTGWFRFASSGPEAFRLAARLLEAGADKNRLFHFIEETDRPQRIQMIARALASARFLEGDRAVLMTLSRRDFEETSARSEELSGLVNQPMSVGSVEVSALVTEPEPGAVKVSFRSKPPVNPTPGSPFVDVNQLAAKFGGGGHIHAAGARMETSLEDALQRIEAALVLALQEAGFVDSGSTV